MIEMVCIQCPLGCHLKVEIGDEIKVSGNTCPRGKEYAINEVTRPVRTLTSTVRINNGLFNQLPVITNLPIPKEMMKQVMKELKDVVVNAPIKKGDIIIEDVCGLGVNIIASRSMDRKLNDM